MSAEIVVTERVREQDGWRTGRPAEDPSKLKRWGFVSAKPSEFLVHVRRGRVRARSSGQGASCFKWPGDGVAIVPTSLQRLQFRADQVTREKVGVEVIGFAVYRIADPMLAYRVLNFSYPERAQEKLEQTLGAMFAGASRRLIANLTLDECLQKRKQAIADELMSEIAPIVRGEGSPDDHTTQGWGVVLDTIEVQEVRVLSDKVFAALQAPFRAELDRKALESRAATDRDIALVQSECARAVEETQLRNQLVVQRQQHEAAQTRIFAERDQQKVEADARREIETSRVDADAALRRRQAEIELAEERSRTEEAQERHRLARIEAESEMAICAVKTELAQRRAELSAAVRKGVEAERRVEAALRAEEAQLEAASERLRAEIRSLDAAAEVQRTIAERLPDIAAGIGQGAREMRIVQIGGDGSPFASIVHAIASVVEMAQKPAESRTK